MTPTPDLSFNVADIEKLENNLQQAMLSSDFGALETYLDDDLVSIDPYGRRLNKQQELDFHRAGILNLTQIETSERSVVLLENAATVSWFGRLSGTYYGENFSEKFAFSRVWSLADGQWTIILVHGTRITM